MLPKFVRFVLCVLLPGLVLLSGACGSVVVLNGNVTDAYTGQPIPSANVAIGDVALTTDSGGGYATKSWNASDTLLVSAPGYAPEQVPLDSHYPAAATEPITVTVSTALRPNTIEGTLTDAYTGQPLAGAQVAVLPAGSQAPLADVSSGATTHPTTATHPTDVVTSTTPVTPAAAADAGDAMMTTSDSSGRYALGGVPEQFRLRITAADYEIHEVDIARQTVYHTALRPTLLSGRITDRYTSQPVTRATVGVGSVTTTTDLDGRYILRGMPPGSSIVDVRAEGYAPLSQQFAQTTSLDMVLRPDVLNGALVDQVTGEPVQFATIIATTTPTSTAVAHTRIDNALDGRFTLKGLPESGYVQVLAPGYRKAMMELQAGSVPSTIELEPFHARALYVKTSTVAYAPEVLQEFFDVIDRTELNAIVIDIKSDNLADLGKIYYESQVPIVQELGTSEALMDIHGILAEARKRNIYTIARIHVFSHDNLLAETKPEWAAQTTKPGGCVPNENRKCNGNVFYADWDVAWLDPWNREVWDYNIQLGIEAAQLGFDEVQFDYIRFPSDASDYEYMQLLKPIDPENNPQPMYENITTFMEQALQAINHVGAFFSVDVFGYTIWRPEPRIGQNPALMAPHADYICPMVYPSHYWVNELGFDNSAAHPYEIVHESLRLGGNMVEGKRAKLRPWLQDFTLIWVHPSLVVEYGPQEVRAQIEATESFTYTVGWSLWSADNEYTYGALQPE
jgi:protocatechuate 3,4-dioxygenase beta subunit